MNTKETEEDPRYIKGQIYKIISSNTEKIYIGSTILPLDLRFSLHKSSKKKCTSMHIINEGNASIKLICEYPCKNKIELELEENRWMLALREEGFEVVNKCTPGAYAAAGGSKEYKKEYCKANNEKIIKQKAEYYKANKEKITKQKAEYNKNRRPRFKCICCNKDYPSANLKIHQQTVKYNRNMMGLEDIRLINDN
jgi:hypothetical protein